MASRVVIDNAILHGIRGSTPDPFPQRVATVYFEGGEEFRVMAPSRATGDALEWLKYVEVRRQGTQGYTPIPSTDHRYNAIIKVVAEELERQKLDTDTLESGTIDAGRFYTAQICLRGHVHSANGVLGFVRGEHCPQCGEVVIHNCQHCSVPIRGNGTHTTLHYKLPYFCHRCGHAYPWMEDRLQTAKELLDHDDKLTLEDREKLWGLLQYVMSDPKADLIPAKKKLIEISLGGAAAATREIVLDLLAKITAEMFKP
jgi:hypothetical protein